ncbi:MAG: hypothetical protein Q8861_07540 [Bacteroidota bacterium]|nr:hypothetical protein [Bacteroidota bacterium]
MMKYCTLLLVFLICLFSCGQHDFKVDNKTFESALNQYCCYVDSLNEYRKDFDFIEIDAKKNQNCTYFKIHLSGGGYPFIHKSVIDFLKYKKYDVILVGDYPNEIITVHKNQKINPVVDILKERYPEDYKKYTVDKRLVPPLIYDYKILKLKFVNRKLIYSEISYGIGNSSEWWW